MFGPNGTEILWLAMAGIAAWTVLMCLKVISFNIDHAMAFYKLTAEVKALRKARLKRQMIPDAEVVDIGLEPHPGEGRRGPVAAAVPPEEKAGLPDDAGVEAMTADDGAVPGETAPAAQAA